jgi:C4-dicarboxylate-binding protein DctP
MTSSEFLESLDDDTRAQFMQIANDVTQDANQTVKAKEAANRANILKAGGKINSLTPAQRQEWVDTMKPVWSQFDKYIGKDLVKAAAES